MTGSQFGTFILALIGIAIVVAIAVWLLHWLYLRSSKERAFVRTGLGGQHPSAYVVRTQRGDDQASSPSTWKARA